MIKSLFYFLFAWRMIAAPAGGYHVTKEIHIGGEGGWDYLTVDSAARRLYVSHATKVVVIDLDSDKVVGEIPNTQGVHGIAIAPDLKKGFVSDGRSNSVTVFDLATLKQTGTVQTGKNPDAILYEPTSHRTFTFNGGSKDSTVINAKTGQVEGTLPLGGKPEFSAADGKGKIFVNIEDTNELVRLDAASMKEEARFSLKPCDSPSGLAIDERSSTLFSVCDGKVMAISSGKEGKLITTAPIGEGPDGVAYDPGTNSAFSSNGRDGTVTVVKGSGSKWNVVENAATMKGARTIAVDTKTHKLYLPVADVDTAAGLGPNGRPKYKADTFKVLVVSK